MNDEYNYSDLDLKNIFAVIFKERITVIVTVLIISILTIVYSLNLKDVYSSTATLYPVDRNEQVGNYESYTALAGFAGISIPKSSNRSSEALKRIVSFDFFVDQFLPNIKLEDLYAADEWDSKKNILKYKKNLFNEENKDWEYTDQLKSKKPTKQQAFKVYKNIVSATNESGSNFVTITVNHKSPHIAKSWVELIIKKINSSMREIDQKIASEAINFLNEREKNTQLTELNDAISQLLKSQMQVLMMASVNEDYIFRVVSSPISPEERSAPNRSVIVMIGIIFGLLMGFLFALLKSYFYPLLINK